MIDLLKIIDKNVASVFLTMAKLVAIPGVGDPQAMRPSMLKGVTGSVSLSGAASGVVYTGFSQKLAEAVATRVLGAGAHPEEVVSDVVGEFTNIITGNLKSILCDEGYPCQLSIPTVLRGGEISVVSNSAPICLRNTYFFEEFQEELDILVFAKLEK